MAKKVGDLLSWGLILMSFWLFSFLLNILPTIGKIMGIIGSVITLIVEGYFLLTK